MKAKTKGLTPEQVKIQDDKLLAKILKDNKLNIQQLCKLLPDSVIEHRIAPIIEQEGEAYKQEAIKNEKKNRRFKAEVEFFELRARRVTAHKIIWKEEELKEGWGKQIATEIFKELEIKEEKNGTEQGFNMRLKKEKRRIYAKLGIPLPPELKEEKSDPPKTKEDK